MRRQGCHQGVDRPDLPVAKSGVPGSPPRGAYLAPSWWKRSATGRAGPRSSAGAPSSPCIQEQDLSTRTLCPVTRNHSSVAKVLVCNAAAPRTIA